MRRAVGFNECGISTEAPDRRTDPRRAAIGLQSAYHEFHGETLGGESRPTLYYLYAKERPFHCDYCFVPHDWIARVREVDVGSYAAWKGMSDHRPLTVDIELDKSSTPPVRETRHTLTTAR